MPLCGLFTPNRDNVWTDISLCDLFRHIMIHVWTLMPLSDLIRLSSIHFETDMPLYYFFRHNRVHVGTDMPLCTCLDIVESRVRLICFCLTRLDRILASVPTYLFYIIPWD